MSTEYTPTTEDVRNGYSYDPEYEYHHPDNPGYVYLNRAAFDRWLAAHDREVAAKAWDEGHQASERRAPNGCICSAWHEGECACGRYGTGTLLSLNDNPYRQTEGESE